MLPINVNARLAAANDLRNDNAGSDTASSANDPAGFASLLRQSQVAVAVAPTPAATHGVTANASPVAPASADDAESTSESTATAHAENETSSQAAPAPEETDAMKTARLQARAKLRGAVHTGTPDATAKAEPPDAPPAGTAATDSKTTAKTADTSPSADPALAQWLATLQRAQPDRPAASGDADTATAATATATADEPAHAASGKHALSPAELKAEAALKGQTAAGETNFGAALEAAAATPAQAQPLPTTATGAAQAITDAAAAAAAAGLKASTTEAAPVAAPVPVAIATPVDAPEFAQALGLQLSVLAKDGVQQAELHLNPADMGPVSVQIVMDGTQARVDFGADVAATRAAIEAGLPALASALQDAGFTLTGGGVSQQSSPRGDAGDGRSSDGRSSDGRSHGRGGDGRSDSSVTAGVAARARRVALGAVDLYA